MKIKYRIVLNNHSLCIHCSKYTYLLGLSCEIMAYPNKIARYFYPSDFMKGMYKYIHA